MRSTLLVVMLLACHLAYADAPELVAPPAEASQMAMHARELAQQGHCTEALRLRPVIEGLDAETARHAFTDDPYLTWCAERTSAWPVARALPTPRSSSVSAPVPVPMPVPAPCLTGGYLEPSLHSTHDGTGTGVLSRIAAGMRIRSCEHPVQARVGASLLFGHIGGRGGSGGGGGEAELSWTASDMFRVGGHVAIERISHAYLVSADLRLHFDDVLWIQLGAYRNTHASAGGIDTGTGITFGAGVEGTFGAVLGTTELCVGGLLLAAVVASAPNTH